MIHGLNRWIGFFSKSIEQPKTNDMPFSAHSRNQWLCCTQRVVYHQTMLSFWKGCLPWDRDSNKLQDVILVSS